MLHVRRRGAVMVYMVGAIVVFIGICSFAVDYGRVQLAKAQMRCAADAAALAAAGVLRSGPGKVRETAIEYVKLNLPDVKDPIVAATDVTFGYWGDPQDLIDGPDDDDEPFDSPNDDLEDPDVTPEFTPLDAGDGRANAVKVELSRTAERGNAPGLVFGAALGAKTCDVHVSAIAVGYTGYPGDGFVGIKKLKMEKRSDTDSYRSDWGPYRGYPAGERGSVKTNGKLKFKKDVTIHGDAHPGVKSKRPAQGGTVTGSRAPLTYMLSYPPVEVLPRKKPHEKPPHRGNFEVEEHTTYTLTEGVYRYKDFKVEKGATLNLVGEVTLMLDGKFEMQGTVNTFQNKPANLRIRMIGKKEVKIGKGLSLYADIYAPLAKAKIDKGSTLYGALIAKEFKVGDRGALHFDESLYAESVGASLVQ